MRRLFRRVSPALGTKNLEGFMYRLLGFPTQNTKKTLYVLEEVGVDYEFKLVNLMKGENKSESFLKLNPIGKVPVLQHDDASLFESGAICRYVANVENSPLYPRDKLQRAKVDQWMDFFSCHLGRWLSTLYYEKIVKARANIGSPDEKSCDEAMKFSARQLAIVDNWLQANTYLTGNNLSIADMFAFAYIEQVKDIDLSLDEFPYVGQWLDAIEKKESVKRARQRLAH